MISYGYTIQERGLGGSRTISVNGYSSPLEAKVAAYMVIIRDGWRPDPLREKWWQFWRSAEWPEELEIAMQRSEEKPDDV